MTTAALDTGRSTAPPAARDSGSRRHVAALVAICLLSAGLYAWGLGDSWGNTYYTAAVKSMSQSFENFLFGSFDPVGAVTVDKPPMALWVQVLSVMVFGYNKVAILLPQAVAGVATVFLLHRTVRRWAGEHAALLAALVVALTPITVAINHDNNPDTLLVLLVVAAAYALTRAIDDETAPSRATGWVLFAALLVGCGFMTKMLQAWMVLPAFIAAYLIGRNASWGRRLGDLAAAAVMVLVSSFWWVAATALWPSPKPYIGGSEDGSAWDLIIGYNGFGRLFGGEGNMGGGGGSGKGRPSGAPGGQAPDASAMPGGGPGGGGGFSGESGILRFANEQLAGQISWLLPLCTVILASTLVLAVLRWRGGGTIDRGHAAGWTVWGGWLVVIGLMFSFAQGTMHPYYTTMLAPAVGAVVGAGIVRLWRWYREPRGAAWMLLPLGVIVTVAWALVLVLRNPDWNVWAGYVAVALGALAVVALVVARRKGVLAKVGLSLSIAAVLAVPAAWSSAAAVAGTESGMGGANPTAGPSTGGPGGGFPPGRDGTRAGGGDAHGGQPGQQARGRQGGPGGFGGETLSDDQRELLDYVVANAGDAEIPLATEGGAHSASSFLINSDVTVVGMGGFMGSDDAPSVELLTRWQQEDRLGYVLLGGGPGGMRGGPNAGQPGSGQQPARAQGPGRMGEANTERSEWVRKSCALVDPVAYGGSAPSGDSESSSQQLYDCRKG